MTTQEIYDKSKEILLNFIKKNMRKLGARIATGKSNLQFSTSENFEIDTKELVTIPTIKTPTGYHDVKLVGIGNDVLYVNTENGTYYQSELDLKNLFEISFCVEKTLITE